MLGHKEILMLYGIRSTGALKPWRPFGAQFGKNMVVMRRDFND